jgi:hypothetical protein
MSAKSISFILLKTKSLIASASRTFSRVTSKSFKDRYSSATAKSVLLFASGSACARDMLLAYFAPVSKTSSRPS